MSPRRERPRCERCARTVPATEAEARDWNVVFRGGYVVGYLCPRCQTPQEHAEATVNEATSDYRDLRLDEHGRATLPLPEGMQ